MQKINLIKKKNILIKKIKSIKRFKICFKIQKKKKKKL